MKDLMNECAKERRTRPSFFLGAAELEKLLSSNAEAQELKLPD
jgi:hypothetical protein